MEKTADTRNSILDDFFPSPMTNLVNSPFRFDFFQAVRLLGIAATQKKGEAISRPDRAVGEDFQPADEFVRFRALVAHSFPACAIASLELDNSNRESDPTHGRPPDMTVTFMGLTGPNGVLPQHYTQLLIDRVRRKDFSLRDFLDMFHHRVISHFFRTWRKYHLAPSYEAAKLDSRDETDVFSQSLYSLVGLGTHGLRKRQSLFDETFLYYGGLFAHFPRTAVSLERAVADYFDLPVKIKQFQGQWLQLDVADQSRMTSDDPYQSANNALGVSTVVGQRVWSVENKFRIQLGPLSYERFRTLLPTGEALQNIAQFVRTYVGAALEFELQPILRRSEVPICCLGHEQAPALLGWNTWIRNAEMFRDGEDAVFMLEGAPTR